MKNNLKKTLCLLISFIMICAMFTACKSDAEKQADSNNEKEHSDAEKQADSNNEKEHPVATITVKDYGVITVELYQDVAPNTVANFISLAKSGFYNGLTFHRVIEDFMIQGGDPEGTGTGGPGYCIKGEFTANGFENKLSHKPGVISMARQSSPMDSAGSQFFICTSDCYYLDGQYAGFGKVTSGLDVAYAIAKEGNQYNSTPAEPIVIESITIDEKGGDYSVVEKLEEK